jgi:putative transposase
MKCLTMGWALSEGCRLRRAGWCLGMSNLDPFKYFHSSPEIIRLAVILYVRLPLSLRNVEDLLHERGIEISHETVRFWWKRFGPMFASEITRKRRNKALSHSNW